MDLTIIPTITATAPNYSFQWMRSDNRNFGIRVLSNDLFTLGFAKVDNILNSIGQTVSMTVTSPTPTQAIYSSTFQKYTAEYTCQADNTLATAQRIFTNLYLKRGGMETIWSLAFTTATNTQTWTNNNTQVGIVRGE